MERQVEEDAPDEEQKEKMTTKCTGAVTSFSGDVGFFHINHVAWEK